MAKRLITAAVLLGVVALGYFTIQFRVLPVLLLAVLGVLCALELSSMSRQGGIRLSRPVSVGVVLLLVFFGAKGSLETIPLVFAIGVLGAFGRRMVEGPVEGAWKDVAATLGSMLYVGLPVAAMAHLWMLNGQTRTALLLMLTVAWSTDTMALVVGRAMGKVKAFPNLSPNKTLEGCAGGMIGALIPAVVVRICWPEAFRAVSDAELVLVSAGLGILTQMGDLAESLIKRDLGVKDSGNAIVGHGGALDRLDSVLFIALPFYCYLKIVHPFIF